MVLRFGCVFCLMLLLGVSPATAAPLFEDNAVLEIELVGPLSSLFENKDDSQQLPFILRANGEDHSVNVRVRGKSRKRVCTFPPLRISFPENRAMDPVFEGQGRLKLVTHCRKGSASATDVLQEYAAYRMFNLISDVSYRVRLLHITYTDTAAGAGVEPLSRYGFFIEPAPAMASRVGGLPAKETAISLASLDSQHAAAVYVFQYLIGNTDWSFVMADADDTCCHNGDILDIGSNRYYVPYDFDLAGLVNARYAKPDPTLRLSSVKKRMYRGFCSSGDDVRVALGDIHAKKTEIMQLIHDLPGLSQKEAKATAKYVEQFFDRTSSADKAIRTFERTCVD